ncbi:unnamed protein product, partial [Symbiodinium sp. KB8]
EQTSWTPEDLSWELAWVPNYSSVSERKEFVRARFDEGGEFKKRFGEDRTIAAPAVIVEDEEKDKKRIIRDATHGVKVNNRIKCRDKIRANEHGYMGCQIDETETFFGDPDSQIVYVNKVGTFGLDSRVEVIAPHGGSPVSRRLLIRVHQYLAGDGAKGIPSNGAKTRGGYCVEWFGMETDTRPISSGCRRSGRAGWPAVLRPFLGRFHAWSGATQGKDGLLVIPRLVLHGGLPPLSFFADAEAGGSQWILRDINQLADDLTNEEFANFDPALRRPLKREDFTWRILDRLLVQSDSR